MIPEAEIAWAAGFFEGEGSVMLLSGRASRAFPQLSVEVSQIDREPLDWLADRWRGPIYAYGAKGSNAHPFFRWTLTANQAVIFLAAIEPFVIRPIVRERIALGLAYQAQKTATWTNRTAEYADRQRAFTAQMSALNHRADLTELERLVLTNRLATA